MLFNASTKIQEPRGNIARISVLVAILWVVLKCYPYILEHSPNILCVLSQPPNITYMHT